MTWVFADDIMKALRPSHVFLALPLRIFIMHGGFAVYTGQKGENHEWMESRGLPTSGMDISM